MVVPSLRLPSLLHAGGQGVSFLEEEGDGKQLVMHVSGGAPALPCQEPCNR